MLQHIDSAEICALGAGVIGCMAKGDQARREDVAQGTLRVLTQAMTQHIDCDRVQYLGNLAINHLCLLTPANKKICMDHGAHSVIVAGMARNLNSQRSLVWGMRALCTLAINEYQTAEALRDENMLASTVVQACNRYPANREIQEWGKKALSLTQHLAC